jgi:hypothetical protein
MPKDRKPVEHSFLCQCGARFDSRDEYLKHRSAMVDTSAHLTWKEIEKGEPGQTEEERREWQDIQREEQA